MNLLLKTQLTYLRKYLIYILTFLFNLFIGTTLIHANEIIVNQNLPSLGTGQTRLLGPGVNKVVTYENIGSIGLVEGDIAVLLPRDDSPVATNGVVIDGFRWPDNTLHYRLDNVSSNVATMVRNAVAHIEALTNVDIIELPASATTPYHVRVVDDTFACYSYVGDRRDVFVTSQELNVVSACGFGSTVHEFLHALGMFHEQSREDRNSYVEIRLENVEPGKEHNFNQQIIGASDVQSYDYGSIMHYSSHAFSINGQPTIVPLMPGVGLGDIGQRSGMSTTDIATINSIYPSSAVQIEIIEYYDGYQVPIITN